METLKAMTKRASVREYQAKPVEKKLLEQIVDAGRHAPTARGVEPWEFVVVQDKAVLAELSRIANNGFFIKDAAACIVVFCQDTKYYLEDGCAAVENILVAATDSGLGACWVAGDKKDYAPEVARLLNAGTGMKLICLIPLGWPKKEPSPKKRRSLADVLHWEKF
jgi:nitroreductase